ncbi:MAG: hypothetical protein PHF12_02025 [Candidatus Omnitrophica bacterium]|jgi:hypothetical protein|nr:hypothetical protein [Candidatus Omnitrophota bacterium]
MTSDSLIYGLSVLFFASIVFWAVSAYAEMIIYRAVQEASRLIQGILKTHREAGEEGPTDYSIVEGRYKNRAMICRINRIAARSWWNFKLDLHCHVEPLRTPAQDKAWSSKPLGHADDVYYPATSTTFVRSFGPSEKLSKNDVLNIFEDLTKAAEIIENQEPV